MGKLSGKPFKSFLSKKLHGKDNKKVKQTRHSSISPNVFADPLSFALLQRYNEQS